MKDNKRVVGIHNWYTTDLLASQIFDLVLVTYLFGKTYCSDFVHSMSTPRELIVTCMSNNWLNKFYGFQLVYMTLAVDNMDGCGLISKVHQ